MPTNYHDDDNNKDVRDMTDTIVHLVRHGEVYNPDKILYGRLDGFHLTGRGQAQAARVARSLCDHDITYLAASPLLRAQLTATPLSEALGRDIEVDSRLIEAGNLLEGLHIKGIDSALWNPHLWPLIANPLVPSWGEAYTRIADRMMAAVYDARHKAQGHEAVLVSHQLPIVMVQRSVEHKRLAHNPMWRRCALASVTSLMFSGSTLERMVYSEPAAIVE